MLFVLQSVNLLIVLQSVSLLINLQSVTLLIVLHSVDLSIVLQAVNLLCMMNWNTDAAMCYQCLSAIMLFLLRMPLNVHRESE